MLLLLQAFFLVDFTFLNAEIATDAGSLATGVLVNAALFALAAIKLGVVLKVLKPSFSRLQFGFVLLQLGALFAAPCVLRWLNMNGSPVGARHLYALWWLLALLPAIYEGLMRLDPSRGRSVGAQTAPTMSYLALPYLSLLTHIAILHYVYDIGFRGAHAAPLLLGLTLVLNRFNPSAMAPRRDLIILRVLLPLAAVLVSLNNPFVFHVSSAYPKLILTPGNLTVCGAFLTYVYCFLLPHAWLFLGTGLVAALAYVLGPTRQQIGNASGATWEWTSTLTMRLVPKSLADWGVWGLVASFGFLGIGLWVSLRKQAHPEESDDANPATPPAS